jgi:hypothetical protein
MLSKLLCIRHVNNIRLIIIIIRHKILSSVGPFDFYLVNTTACTIFFLRQKEPYATATEGVYALIASIKNLKVMKLDSSSLLRKPQK